MAVSRIVVLQLVLFLCACKEAEAAAWMIPTTCAGQQQQQQQTSRRRATPMTFRGLPSSLPFFNNHRKEYGPCLGNPRPRCGETILAAAARQQQQVLRDIAPGGGGGCDDNTEATAANVQQLRMRILPVAKILVSDSIAESEVDTVCRLLIVASSNVWNNVAPTATTTTDEDEDEDESAATQLLPLVDYRTYFDVERVALDESSSSRLIKHELLLPAGATGRALIVQVFGGDDGYHPRCPSLLLELMSDADAIETWRMQVSEQMDALLYSESPPIRQPILLSIESSSSSSVQLLPSNDDDATTGTTAAAAADRLISLIASQVEDYGLTEALAANHDVDLKAFFPVLAPEVFVPTLRYEVDGAMVLDNTNSNNKNDDDAASSEQSSVWDTSSFFVLDQLVTDDLRRRMLATVLGQDDYDDDDQPLWDDVANGPDPSRWVQGGLVDLATTEGNAEECENEEFADVSFGLTDDALDDLCRQPPPDPFQEFESILTRLFSDFIVSRMPEAVLGECVTPLTANAPCFADGVGSHGFAPHIDADPFSAPPSPWTDVFGRYPNRATGQPRFVSCLVYLNAEWQAAEWGASTRFFDVATDTSVDVAAKPGRVVVLDQDITHTVVAPSAAAGNRPRYSLVWKLVLHPKQKDQNMRQLSRPGWPEPILVGSANR